MAKQTINIGSAANDGTGDPLRTAFTKANDNFTELYNRADIPSQTSNAGKYLTTTGTTLGWAALGAAAVSNSYDDLDDLPTLGTVASTNSYDDLDDLPTIPTASSLSVDDLITLSGVAEGAVNLGSFTGTTIGDNLTIKASLQALETIVETKLPTSSYTAADVLTKLLTVDGASSTLDADLLDGEQGSHYLDYTNFTNTPTIPTASSLSVDDLISLSGMPEGSGTLGVFSGSTIADNRTIKQALQSLETALEAIVVPTASSLSVDDLITLSGVAEGAVNLGSFTGTTITDNRTVKEALQDLETALEGIVVPTASSLSVDDLITLSGVAEGSANLGTFTGSTIDDSQTVKQALQALETAVEGKQATISTVLTLTASTSEPTVSAGTFAVADGTSWDPASKSGAVPYPVFYDGVAWFALY
jgi:hypothetical protein